MPLLPQFVPIVGGLGTSGLALTSLAGLVAAWAWLGLHWRSLSRDATVDPATTAVRAAAEALIGPLLLGALIGGRLLNQVAVPDLQLSAPQTWLAITGTSVSFTGALLGAGAAAWWSRGRRLGPLGWAALDTLAPAAALAVALGWLGLPVVGRQTQWPWGWPAAPGILVQPVQLYAAAAFLALAAYLAWQLRRTDYPGQNVATFLALAGALRFVLAFAAQATATVGPWTLSQVGDAATVLAGLGLAAALGRTAARPRDGGEAS